MRDQRNTPDREVAALAGAQHGVVAQRQLIRLGLDRSAIHRRVKAGRLHPVQRGVYAVGHARLTTLGHWMAAVLTCGAGALLSHRAGAAHLELLPSSRALIDVTVKRSMRPRPGIVLHRTRHLSDEDRYVHRGIPVTSVTRTIADLADVVSQRQLERALNEADKRGLFDLRHLAEVQGRRGRGRLARALEPHRAHPHFTRSDLERLFLDFCRRFDLPLPATNLWILDQEVDAVWEDRMLVVQVDSYTHHSTRFAFEDDRARDIALQLAGYRVVRVTHRRLVQDAGTLARSLRALLDRV